MFVMKLNLSIESLKKRFEKNKEKPQPRNAQETVKEEIWEIISKVNPKASRKMFFIKTAGVPTDELLSIKKWALSTDNFSKAFYGAIKNYHIKNKK